MSASSAIRWLDRLKKQGDVAAKRPGGDRKSGRIEAEAAFLLCEVAETPDITLVELQKKLQARGVSAGIGTLWRLFDRRRITFKNVWPAPSASDFIENAIISLLQRIRPRAFSPAKMEIRASRSA